MKHILVTGAGGQIGTALVPVLRGKFGVKNVIAADRKERPHRKKKHGEGPYISFDIRDGATLDRVVTKYRIDTIYHLAALLSAVAEADPDLAWDVNMNGLRTVLAVARTHNCAVFRPSSIGAFGPSTPPDNTPQDTIQRPTTIYGIIKAAGELLCDYSFHKFGLDTRGLRFPGLISHEAMPGGGTTDYAVAIFHAAIKGEKYTCYLRKGTRLDMMYMPDAIRAAVVIMQADPARLRHRNAFNITAMSFAPEDIYEEIRKSIPDFRMDYQIDPLRQAIADSWPNSMDDSCARAEWGWKPEYDLPAMVKDMIKNLKKAQS